MQRPLLDSACRDSLHPVGNIAQAGRDLQQRVGRGLGNGKLLRDKDHGTGFLLETTGRPDATWEWCTRPTSGNLRLSQLKSFAQYLLTQCKGPVLWMRETPAVLWAGWVVQPRSTLGRGAQHPCVMDVSGHSTSLFHHGWSWIPSLPYLPSKVKKTQGSLQGLSPKCRRQSQISSAPGVQSHFLNPSRFPPIGAQSMQKKNSHLQRPGWPAELGFEQTWLPAHTAPPPGPGQDWAAADTCAHPGESRRLQGTAPHEGSSQNSGQVPEYFPEKKVLWAGSF